jgi:hypothetical protein
MDLDIRVKLLLTQNRMSAAKGDHATGEAVDLLMPLKIGPVNPTGFIVLEKPSPQLKRSTSF